MGKSATAGRPEWKRKITKCMQTTNDNCCNKTNGRGYSTKMVQERKEAAKKWMEQLGRHAVDGTLSKACLEAGVKEGKPWPELGKLLFGQEYKGNSTAVQEDQSKSKARKRNRGD